MNDGFFEISCRSSEHTLDRSGWHFVGHRPKETRIMNTPTRSILTATSLVIAFTVMSSRANAGPYVDPVNPITVSAPTVKYEDLNSLVGAPREETRVVARVKVDPMVLITNSGIALLEDSVAEAARRACGADDPRGVVDSKCVRVALEEVKPQMDAILSKARGTSHG